jgi:hypothetical protein
VIKVSLYFRIVWLSVGIVLLAVLQEPKPTPTPQEILLTHIAVLFHTTDDEKESDTKLTISLHDHDDKEIARKVIDKEFFPARTPTKLFPLDFLPSKSFRKEDFSRSKLHLEISPKTTDKWEFYFDVQFSFSDKTGNTKTHKKDGESFIMSEQKRQLIVGLN